MELKKEVIIISGVIASINWKIGLKAENIETIKIKKVNEEEKYHRYMHLINQGKDQQEKILNYYQILGVDKIATQEEIEKSYWKLTKQWDPDKFTTKSLEEKQKVNEKIKELNRAYEILSDKDMRKWFDSLIDNKDNKISFPIKAAFFVGALVLIIYLASEENEKN